MDTLTDWFYARSVNWAPQTNVNWKAVVQVRCFISFIAFTFGLYQLQYMNDDDCFERIYGDRIASVDKGLLYAVLVLYAVDPFVCYLAIPATWTNFIVIVSHLYGGLGLVLRRFLGWRYKHAVSIRAMLVLEALVVAFECCDFSYMYTHRLT